MPTQSVDLTEQQADFIRASVDRGDFRDASDVVGAALRLLQQQEEVDRLKLEHLRRLVREGFDEIDRGEFETITPDTLDDFLASVSATRTDARP